METSILHLRVFPDCLMRWALDNLVSMSSYVMLPLGNCPLVFAKMNYFKENGKSPFILLPYMRVRTHISCSGKWL